MEASPEQPEEGEPALRVLLDAGLCSRHGHALLRPLHFSCTSGRTATLAGITHLRFDRSKQLNVAPSRQLAVLAAAPKVKALTIHADQIEGLCNVLAGPQQALLPPPEPAASHQSPRGEQQQQQAALVLAPPPTASQQQPVHRGRQKLVARRRPRAQAGQPQAETDQPQAETDQQQQEDAGRGVAQDTGAFPDLMRLYVSHQYSFLSAMHATGSSISTYAFDANRNGSSSAFLIPTTAAADATTTLSSSTYASNGDGAGSSNACPVPVTAAVDPPSTLSSSSSVSWAMADPMQPASKPGAPSLTHLRVVGEMTQAKVRQLVRLLDVLPGTHHLQHLVLGNVVPAGLFGRDLSTTCSSNRPGTLTRPPRKVAAAIEAEEGGNFLSSSTQDSNSSSSGKGTASTSSTSKGGEQLPGWPAAVGASTAAVGSSWRSSCLTLQASKHEPGDNLYLQPLLEAQQQLQVLYLEGAGVPEGLLQCAASLQLLHTFHVHALQGSVSLDLMHAVAGLTGLRHLGITQSAIPVDVFAAAASTALGHLTSLDLSASSITQHTLEHIVGLTGLRELVLAECSNLRALPDSISRLVSLESLKMWGTRCYMLPLGMTALTGLRTLEWSKAGVGGYVWLELVMQLSSLQSLTLGNAWPKAMLADISQLTALTHLGLDACCLFPDSLSWLVGLQQLWVTSTEQLTKLPEGLTALTQLSLVDVPHEHLEDVSEELQAFLNERKPGSNPG